VNQRLLKLQTRSKNEVSANEYWSFHGIELEQSKGTERQAIWATQYEHTGAEGVVMMTVAPSLSATIDGEVRRFENIRDKIDALEEAWRAYNGPRSVIDYNHFTYYQIMGCGLFAVPHLLEKVRSGSNFWYVALRAICGDTADSPEMRGNPEATRNAWIRWATTKTYPAADVASTTASRNMDAPPALGSESRPF